MEQSDPLEVTRELKRSLDNVWAICGLVASNTTTREMQKTLAFAIAVLEELEQRLEDQINGD